MREFCDSDTSEIQVAPVCDSCSEGHLASHDISSTNYRIIDRLIRERSLYEALRAVDSDYEDNNFIT